MNLDVALLIEELERKHAGLKWATVGGDSTNSRQSRRLKLNCYSKVEQQLSSAQPALRHQSQLPLVVPDPADGFDPDGHTESTHAAVQIGCNGAVRPGENVDTHTSPSRAHPRKSEGEERNVEFQQRHLLTCLGTFHQSRYSNELSRSRNRAV